MTRRSPSTASPPRERGQLLSEPVALAWQAFDRAAERTCRVTPAVPILFFGDLDAYLASPLRVVTVGLNPSLHEFPAGEPFRRFPLAEGDREPSRYLDAMSAYFRTDPYSRWFNAFEPLLNGMGASYYEGGASTALHTDICSPVATDPTWNDLDKATQTALMDHGRPLWHMLLEKLRPQVVVLSVRKKYLDHIEFAPMNGWEVIHTFKRTRSGEFRSQPYEVCARWYEVASERLLFVFGAAAQMPLGKLAASQKREAGKLLAEIYRDG